MFLILVLLLSPGSEAFLSSGPTASNRFLIDLTRSVYLFYRFSSKFVPISFSICDFINGVYLIDSLFLIYYSDASGITTQILTQNVALWGCNIFRCDGVQC